MRRVLRLLIVAVALAAAGCANLCKPDIRTVHEPQIVEIETRYFVPIDDALTTQHHVANGRISECLSIAASRGAELRKCNADKAAIREIQGKQKTENGK